MALRMEVQRTIRIETGRTPILVADLGDNRFGVSQGSSRINIGPSEYEHIGDAIEALTEGDNTNG